MNSDRKAVTIYFFGGFFSLTSDPWLPHTEISPILTEVKCAGEVLFRNAPRTKLVFVIWKAYLSAVSHDKNMEMRKGIILKMMGKTGIKQYEVKTN